MQNKKQIEQIYSAYTISIQDTMNTSKEKLDKIIKQNLAREVSSFILDNMDTLPIEYTIEKSDGLWNVCYDHKIKINIISDEELKRLKEIEYMYNGLCK